MLASPPPLSRSENASRAQLKFIEDFPEEGRLLQSLAGAMAT